MRNLASSSGVKVVIALPVALCCRDTPTTRRYGVRTLTDAGLRFAFEPPLEAWKMDATPMMLTRVPGEMRSESVRSTLRRMWRGISPVGTASGASCNFNVCWFTNLDFSGMIT